MTALHTPVSQGMITYSGRCHRGTSTKKILWNTVRVETMLVAFPTNRTRLPTKDREAFSKQGFCLGERSTCDPTYSGVTFRSTGSLPRCSEETKKLIYGAQRELPALPAQIRNAIGAGEPLIWQESKSVEM